MIAARYADGRAAVLKPAWCEITADALFIAVGEARHRWAYGELARGDDNNGVIVLKRKPDTGERLVLPAEAADQLRAAAPVLFSSAALGAERPRLVVALAGAALTLAAAFLIGVPLSAGPIADAMPEQYRTQISDISWSQVNAFTTTCDDSDQAAEILNAMAHRMMTAADVAKRDMIWITIVDAPIPNAFALPDESIIITADLIEIAESPDEIAGVLAHEIAHIERNHVMKNIVGNIGAGIFFDIVFGGAGVGQAVAIASVNLAGLRYSRAYEEDADARGLDILDAAGINPGGIADMFENIRAAFAEEDSAAVEEIPTLLSTHPNTERRVAAARARARPDRAPALTDEEWRIVRSACGRGAPGDDNVLQPTTVPDPDKNPEGDKGLMGPAKTYTPRLPSRARAG